MKSPPLEPYSLFESWYEDAKRCDAIQYADAMCLATVDPHGLPDGRIVLLEDFDADGFIFFTDVESRKGRDLARLPEAALIFYWGPLERQVRIRGPVARATDEEADACFAKRPRRSRITAWASLQSREVAGREDLDARYREFEARFVDQEDVPRPAHWQAFRLAPRTLELWQAGAKRLHDQLLYTRESDGSWRRSRLYP
jgi:pyridoxamine 5'-phosphate oxidase